MVQGCQVIFYWMADSLLAVVLNNKTIHFILNENFPKPKYYQKHNMVENHKIRVKIILDFIQTLINNFSE